MSVQQTLDGEATDKVREPPETIIWCDECKTSLLRSERHDHPCDLSTADSYETVVVRKEREALEDKIPGDATDLETQKWTIEFHDRVVEAVTVEATSRMEARRIAQEERTYDGEYMETVHTDYTSHGELSTPTIEYLEKCGLLSDDHDVTQEDIERLIELQEDG